MPGKDKSDAAARLEVHCSWIGWVEVEEEKEVFNCTWAIWGGILNERDRLMVFGCSASFWGRCGKMLL